MTAEPTARPDDDILGWWESQAPQGDRRSKSVCGGAEGQDGIFSDMSMLML
ncbi:hypothetical protein LIZ34_00670 [Intestinimonas butyriciproducens]|uniref:hypothetical protein n=1 Tax=Intestinimonas butyriciproducens TaxID=1297617 RepID=UPI001AB029CF|nr:hypothetical protein [Intestinimonas butyriciproducens]MBO3278994.1 hypothetical protein [Intestinimonas butyriciproducens]MCB7048888.1 hypothetical protein [Intestinimonas butyriciproducens]